MAKKEMSKVSSDRQATYDEHKVLGDVVVVCNGRPVASYPTGSGVATKDNPEAPWDEENLGRAIELGKLHAQELKVSAMRRGDPIPDVVIGRNCVCPTLNDHQGHIEPLPV